jgi:hypothetical protein
MPREDRLSSTFARWAWLGLESTADAEPITCLRSCGTATGSVTADTAVYRFVTGFVDSPETRMVRRFYSLKAGPVGDLRPPSGPAATRREPELPAPRRAGWNQMKAGAAIKGRQAA